MQFHLTIDTTQPLSDTDRLILQALLGQESPSAATETSQGAQAPATASKAKKAPKDDAGDTSEGPNPDLLAEAVHRATALIDEKKGAKVRAALKKAGAVKVTELTDDESIRKFLAALP